MQDVDIGANVEDGPVTRGEERPRISILLDLLPFSSLFSSSLTHPFHLHYVWYGVRVLFYSSSSIVFAPALFLNFF